MPRATFTKRRNREIDETTYLEGMSSVDQILLLQSAESIIGAHGAGLSNLLFCEPGTKVIEFMRTTLPSILTNSGRSSGWSMRTSLRSYGTDEQQRTCTPRDTGRYFAPHG